MKIMNQKTAVLAAVMVCCVSCHREGPTVAEEICHVRDSLLDKNIAHVCFYPPECRIYEDEWHNCPYEEEELRDALQRKADSVRSLYVYYDNGNHGFDYTKDPHGKPFTKKDLTSDIYADEERGFYIELLDWDELHYLDAGLRGNRYDEFMERLEASIVDINHTPEVTDILRYFHNVPTYMLLPTYDDRGVHSVAVDSVDRPCFIRVLQQMQDYMDNKTQEFPREIIEYWYSNEGYKTANYAHTGEMAECFFTLVFQYRLIQQIARHCPDIRQITDYYTTDGMVGLCRDFWYPVDYNYVLLRQKDHSYCVDIVYNSYELETIPDQSGDTIYSVGSGLYRWNYQFDGNQWHRYEADPR